jgi:hypothetical protein
MPCRSAEAAKNLSGYTAIAAFGSSYRKHCSRVLTQFLDEYRHSASKRKEYAGSYRGDARKALKP